MDCECNCRRSVFKHERAGWPGWALDNSPCMATLRRKQDGVVNLCEISTLYDKSWSYNSVDNTISWIPRFDILPPKMNVMNVVAICWWNITLQNTISSPRANQLPSLTCNRNQFLAAGGRRQWRHRICVPSVAPSSVVGFHHDCFPVKLSIKPVHS